MEIENANSFIMSTYIKNDQKKVDIHGVIGYFKRLNQMAELKWVWTMLSITGYTAYIWALFLSFANVDFFTRMVLSVVGALFLLAKLIVYCVSAVRKHRLENLEIRKLMNEQVDRELDIRQRSIDTYHKETEIIKNFNGQ